jgi:hypothetical protein
MKEPMHHANEELKRAEHLLYVSLKYTRTVDVLRSAIERMIACFNYLIEGILNHKEEEGIIFEVPKSPFASIELMKEIYKDDRGMLEYMEFYSTLRRIIRAEFTAESEFRRNVKMISNVEGKKIEINIDLIGDYHKTEEFLRYVKNYHQTRAR